LWGAAVVWGSPGESASPRDVPVVAAAGPAVNAVVAAVGLIAGLFALGDVRIFFGLRVAVNLLFFAVNARPLRARSKTGQLRIGTDGAIVVRALQAARLGPGLVDLLSPAGAPSTLTAGSATCAEDPFRAL